MNKPIVYRRTLVTQAYHSLSLKRLFSLFSITSTAFIASGCQSIAPGYSESSVLIENTYSRAKEFTAEQLRDKAHNLWLDANWLEDNQSEFWFERYSVKNGQEFVLVNPQDQQMRALFDPSVLSKALLTSDLIESSINWKDSPMHSVVYTKGDIAFSINEQLFKCSLERDNYKCISNDDKDSKKVLSQEQYTSPNGASYVRVVDYNLQLCSVESNACQQLTQDGTELTPYAVKHPYPESSLADAEFDPQKHLDIAWSADSRYLISYKLFREGVSKLTLTDSVSKNDFNVNSVDYYYPQAGDQYLPMAQLLLVDTKVQQATLLDAPKVMQTYYGGAIWGEWHENEYYYHDRRRGNREYFLRKVVAKNHSVKTLIKETDPQFIDPWVQTFRPLKHSNHVIWSSQQTGYQHLYLHDASTGEQVNAITEGKFTVRVIRAVDEQNGVLYFEASGREPGRDPYLRHLYRVNLDGTGLTLLTPEPLEHSTQISPDFSYFVDSYSDATTPTVSWLRSTETGEKLLKLDQAEVSELLAVGWQAPEPFAVLADDGKTSLHGLIYKPTNFDPTKQYPVINDTYTGPHNFFTPKSFYTYDNQRPALAELGFIVIKMDGRGTNKRGKDFHRFSYKNLAAGTDDHVWAIKQLAKQRPYMDIDRVGIFGFSAGGYDTMQAMLRHNDFFKAGVSASGNHDFRVDKAGWNEIWMGWPMTAHWDQQSNYNNVERLKGKLLLAHGELDSNVHPSATLRLADKLIKANKDFDLLIMPKMGHVLDESPYFVEKRWRFFIEHLQPQMESRPN